MININIPAATGPDASDNSMTEATSMVKTTIVPAVLTRSEKCYTATVPTFARSDIKALKYVVLQPYQIIVADAADAVSVNFSGRCKFLQI